MNRYRVGADIYVNADSSEEAWTIVSSWQEAADDHRASDLPDDVMVTVRDVEQVGESVEEE